MTRDHLKADRSLAGSAQVGQAFGEGEFVRGDILTEKDYGPPVVFKRALMVQEVGHSQRVL